VGLLCLQLEFAWCICLTDMQSVFVAINLSLEYPSFLMNSSLVVTLSIVMVQHVGLQQHSCWRPCLLHLVTLRHHPQQTTNKAHQLAGGSLPTSPATCQPSFATPHLPPFGRCGFLPQHILVQAPSPLNHPPGFIADQCRSAAHHAHDEHDAHGCRFVSMMPRDQSNYLYLESFKLLLSETAESSIATPLPPGCPHAPEAVIGHFLGFLRFHLQQQLRRSFGADVIDRSEIKYCMTIPAGWSDSAKNRTRQ
jgi:hypothetical protein